MPGRWIGELLIYGLFVDASARSKDQGEAMNADRPWTKILTLESGKGAGKKVMALSLIHI